MSLPLLSKLTTHLHSWYVLLYIPYPSAVTYLCRISLIAHTGNPRTGIFAVENLGGCTIACMYLFAGSFVRKWSVHESPQLSIALVNGVSWSLFTRVASASYIA